MKGKNKELFEKSLEPTIVCQIGYDAICIDCNRKYEEMIGYSREELINKSTHHLVNTEYIDEVFSKHESLKGEIISWEELELIKKDGSIIKVLASSFPLFDEQDNLSAYMHVVKNMTSLYQSKKSNREYDTMVSCTKCSAFYPREYKKCPSCVISHTDFIHI